MIAPNAAKRKVIRAQWIAILVGLYVPAIWAGPYEDCILQNMKGVSDRLAANSVRLACKEKTTPKKCRGEELRRGIIGMDMWEKFDLAAARKSGYTDEELLAYLTGACLKQCAAASFWSRTLGECSTD